MSESLCKKFVINNFDWAPTICVTPAVVFLYELKGISLLELKEMAF